MVRMCTLKKPRDLSEVKKKVLLINSKIREITFHTKKNLQKNGNLTT